MLLRLCCREEVAQRHSCPQPLYPGAHLSHSFSLPLRPGFTELYRSLSRPSSSQPIREATESQSNHIRVTGNMHPHGVIAVCLSISSQALGQVVLPDLPYAEDALEPHISSEVCSLDCRVAPLQAGVACAHHGRAKYGSAFPKSPGCRISRLVMYVVCFWSTVATSTAVHPWPTVTSLQRHVLLPWLLSRSMHSSPKPCRNNRYSLEDQILGPMGHCKMCNPPEQNRESISSYLLQRTSWAMLVSVIPLCFLLPSLACRLL